MTSLWSAQPDETFSLTSGVSLCFFTASPSPTACQGGGERAGLVLQLTLRRLGRYAVDIDGLAAAAVEEHPVSSVAVDWMWMGILSQPVAFVFA